MKGGVILRICLGGMQVSSYHLRAIFSNCRLAMIYFAVNVLAMVLAGLQGMTSADPHLRHKSLLARVHKHRNGL